jgi:GTP-binding protein LepA
VLTAQIKQVRDTRVGDTITHERKGSTDALPGFKPSQPVVFCGLFPVDAADFEDLRDAIEKLALNDASSPTRWRPPPPWASASAAASWGLLHLEVIRDRLEREYDIDLITTAPSVVYHLYMRTATMKELHNPADMPDLTLVDHLEEPRIKATILVPDEYLGAVLKLCQDRRGIQLEPQLRRHRAMVEYDLPLNEVVFDFYDRLKVRHHRLRQLRLPDHRLPRGQPRQDVHPGERRARGRPLHDGPPRPGRDAGPGHGREAQGPDPPPHVQDPDPGRHRRQGHRRETLSALRKDVTAKCYGGDATRKRKLLDKQKAGKKKMRQFGKVDIPQEAFISALKMDG